MTSMAAESYMPRRKAARLTPPLAPAAPPPHLPGVTHGLLRAATANATSPPPSPALSAASSVGSPETAAAVAAARPRPVKQLGRSISERKLFTPTADKLVVVMVGLPARGKSFIAKKLWKFLCWKGLRSEVFNVGQLRRARNAGSVQDHTFFDPNNTRAKEERELLALQSLQQVQDFFLGVGGQRGGDVAVFDATNTTKDRRRTLLDTFDAFAKANKMSVHVVFVESICTNEAVITANITQKVTSSPDYRHMSVDEAVADLKQRMKNYEAAYEALEDEEGISYIKLFDLQSKVHAKGMYVLLWTLSVRCSGADTSWYDVCVCAPQLWPRRQVYPAVHDELPHRAPPDLARARRPLHGGAERFPRDRQRPVHRDALGSAQPTRRAVRALACAVRGRANRRVHGQLERRHRRRHGRGRRDV